jgi:hypothetical protein
MPFWKYYMSYSVPATVLFTKPSLFKFYWSRSLTFVSNGELLIKCLFHISYQNMRYVILCPVALHTALKGTVQRDGSGRN